MISVDRKLSVNPAGSDVKLDREAVWGGLVRKAENAVPFVEAITQCTILERDETGFVREIVILGEVMREHITFRPMEDVTFERLPGASSMGTIVNRIEEDVTGLSLRFTFDLELVGADAEAEKAFREGMEKSYLAAVESTLSRIRAEQREKQA